MAALIRVVNHAGGRATLLDRHIQRLENERGRQSCTHCPPDDAPAPHVEHDRQILRRDIRDFRDPELIRAARLEAAVDQIGSRPGSRVTARRAITPPSSHADHTSQTHQSRDPLSSDPDPSSRSSAKIRGDPYVPLDSRWICSIEIVNARS